MPSSYQLATRLRRTALLAGAALALAPGMAHAADVSPAQATATEQQLHDWLAATLGPKVPLPARPIEMTAAGDHYDVLIPFKRGTDGVAPAVTAKATPIDGGKWQISDIASRIPPSITVSLPPPQQDGKPGTGPNIPVTYHVSIEGQTGGGTIDPSFASPSTVTTSSTATKIDADGGPYSQRTTLGPVTSAVTVTPAADNRVAVAAKAEGKDYAMSAAPGGSPLQVGIGTVHADMTLEGLDRARGTRLLQAIVDMVDSTAPATAGGPARPSSQAVRAVLDAMAGTATHLTLNETGDTIAVNASGTQVAMKQAGFGLDAAADAAGMLVAKVDLGVQGLALPGMDLGPMAALLPSAVSARPTLSGVSAVDANHVIQAMADNRDPTPQEVQALFSHGGVVGGLENLVVAVGGATFNGQGRVLATTPNDFTGEGVITADDFDALMDKVRAVPQAAQAVPVLTLAKGLARNQGGKLVWNINYDGQRLLVNGTDLMAMAGGAPPPRGAAPAQPQGGPQGRAPARPQRQ